MVLVASGWVLYFSVESGKLRLTPVKSMPSGERGRENEDMQIRELDAADEVLVPAALHPYLLRARELDPLYRYLKRHRYSQAWLAGELGIPKQNMFNYFRGVMVAPPGFLERACAVLDTPVAKMRVATPTARRRVS